ncbi:PilN domain-containing protein [Shewanella sp. Isolate11]|uniref:PilN domain-containing protein n=1 Tax=Shewanella sp. Isolate11 TaxID=2908530 RepID=UPI001EFD6629|nr:PilN domain-containing protein [Shewanella sp. Isolate11]MCG9695474.1 fimbrial assembly protein [Shewanella sp. Isolate11]
MATKLRVNLFSESLLPAKLRLSFARLCQGALLLLIVMLSANLVSYVFVSDLTQQKAQLSIQNKEHNRIKNQLEQQVINRKASSVLVAEVDLLTQQLELKRRLLGELGNVQKMTSLGYSSLLTDLATVADNKIWLNRIYVVDGRFEFEGFSSDPLSVPLWVDRLQQVKTLKGQHFSTLTMSRGEGEPLSFVLRSRSDEEATQ